MALLSGSRRQQDAAAAAPASTPAQHDQRQLIPSQPPAAVQPTAAAPAVRRMRPAGEHDQDAGGRDDETERLHAEISALRDKLREETEARTLLEVKNKLLLEMVSVA